MKQRNSRKTKKNRMWSRLRFSVITLLLLLIAAGLGVLTVQGFTAAGNPVSPGGNGESGRQNVGITSAKKAAETDRKIDKKLQKMTLRQKVMQMFIVTPEALTGYRHVTKAGSVTRQKLKSRPVGGLVYFSSNLVTQKQTRQMIRSTQSYSKKYSGIPLFISVDEEGGRVARCAEKLGTIKRRPMYYYHNKGVKTARKNGKLIARDISALGFNLDYAPVADTWTNPKNTVIGDRAYSRDYHQAACLVEGAVKGFHDGGCACVLKHFPGHGNTYGDTHNGSVMVSKSYGELKRSDLIPFQSGIRAGADMVMVSHIIDRKIDRQPASLSRKMVTGILRNKMRYSGVIITDDLAMGAVAKGRSSAASAVMAVKAGNDILLGVTDIDGSADALVASVKKGKITEKQINQSVKRILKLKVKRKIWSP